MRLYKQMFNHRRITHLVKAKPYFQLGAIQNSCPDRTMPDSCSRIFWMWSVSFLCKYIAMNDGRFGNYSELLTAKRCTLEHTNFE